MRGGFMSAVTVLFVEGGLVLAQAPLSPYAPAGGGAVPPTATAASPYRSLPADASPSPVAASPYVPAGGGAVLPVAAAAPAAPAPVSPYVPALPEPAPAPVAEGGSGHAPLEHVPADRNDQVRASAEYLWWKVQGGVPAELHNVLSNGGFDAHSLLGTLPLTRFRSGVRAFIDYEPADGLWPTFEVGGFALQNKGGALDVVAASHPAVNPSAVPSILLLQPVVGGVIQVPVSHGIVDSPIPGPDGQLDLDASDTLVTHIRATSRQADVWGLEANVRSRPFFFGGLRFDFLTGVRYLTLRERLTVQGDYQFIEPPAGGDADETADNPEDNHNNTMHTIDSIDVRNNFYGGQIGTTFEVYLSQRLFLSGFAKLALGSTEERTRVAGQTTMDAATIETNAGGPFIPRPTTVIPGGLFTPPIPGGIATRSSHFAVLPDLNVNLGYQFTPNVQAYVGYNYMHLSNAARLSSASGLVGGPVQSYLELHGLDVGLEFRY